MSTNTPSSLTRLGLVAVTASLVAGACTLELDSDRAAARRIAERIERSVERTASHERSAIDTTAIAAAVDIVFGGAVLDDIASEDDLAVAGVADVDGDGLDDDGEFEISVGDEAACITVDGTSADFEVAPC